MSYYSMTKASICKHLDFFFKEDDLARNFYYTNTLPDDTVNCSLFVKSDLILAGLPIFFETFNYLSGDKSVFPEYNNFEGKKIGASTSPIIKFQLPFNVALTGERIALNILTRLSSIATTTSKFVTKTSPLGIKILDTRKTTPGLRAFEKYAVRLGGASNHRFGQSDVWMIKDNHKSFFGGIKKSIEYFKSINSFYTPIIVEIHSLSELVESIDSNVHHVLLDNFKRDEIIEAIKLKPNNMTYEISGGINITNINNYLIKGIDAISIGKLTSFPDPVDISLKYERA